MLKKFDSFTKSVIIVFAGTSLVNFLNLLFQLLIAHRLPAQEFASFTSLLALLTIISTPLVTLQIALTKYCAEFRANNQIEKIRNFISDLLKKSLILAAFTFLIFFFLSRYILDALKIVSVSSGYIFAALLFTVWFVVIFTGALQGLEFFRWFTFGSVVIGVLKLALAFVLTYLGYNISGALGAVLAANLATILIFYIPLRHLVSFGPVKKVIDYRQDLFMYILPVAVTYLCFMLLVSSDMILVKYFFSPEDSGNYSLAQMVGKIVLALPIAISTVMFPKASGLKAQKLETSSMLNRSLLYALALCLLANLIYNIFPSFTLKVLTGKINPESVFLGRLFGISMGLFAILYTLLFYFLSLKDMRFIKFLVLFTLLQSLAIIFFHACLAQVQIILCVNSFLLLVVNLLLAYIKKPE